MRPPRSRIGALAAAVLVAAALGAPAQARSPGEWPEVLERVAENVVALRVSAPRPFDTESSGVSQATGFVVDAERGLILTNRHVVQPGPVSADAVFLNHEKVSVQPVYRDPVHDFGFFRYDPEALRFLAPAGLALDPAAARVGLDIRVVGNDAGEKLSILAGTLARLDRAAPRYGRGRYNDFNTFYLQAASSSSGGSSGSPVVDRRGRVIALNAGGSREAATSFFLPLDRVARALAALQAGEPVTRGTLQTTFIHESYDELRRLGLGEATEAGLRREHPDAHGLLVVRQVLAGGPAEGVLEPGDVVVEANGEPLLGFAPLEAILDGAVGGTVRLGVERGGEPLLLEVAVADLHAITPDEFLEHGGATLHPLSYQMARSYSVPAGGVFVASRGYAFRQSGIPNRVVITHVDEVPVPDLDAFEAAIARRPHGDVARLRYFRVSQPRNPAVGVLRVDRRWYPMRRCRRDDTTGRWPCREAAAPDAPVALPVATARLEAEGPRALRTLARSLVQVRFDVPFTIDGVQGTSFAGAGLVVDAERGHVVVDRDTVPITLGDVELVFGGSAAVDGRVVAIHPEHNLALVAYDPGRLGDTPVASASLDPRPIEIGEALWQVVMTGRQQLLSRRSAVERVDAPSLSVPRTPRFRESNLDVVALNDSLSGVGGVLADGRGRVRALWLSFSTDTEGKADSFFAGIPASVFVDWLPAMSGDGPAWRTVGAELSVIPLSAARRFGLSDDVARALEDHDARARVLAVRRLTHGTPAAGLLRVGDLIVRVNGALATRFATVERAAQQGRLSLDVVRGGEPVQVEMETPLAPEPDARRLLIWAGALLQEVPPTLAQQRGLDRSGVYVAGRWRGSPADRDGLSPTRRVLAVDDVPTPDLDALLAALASREGAESVRLRVVELDGKVDVLTLEPDPHDWPMREYRRGPEAGWAPVAEPAAAEGPAEAGGAEGEGAGG